MYNEKKTSHSMEIRTRTKGMWRVIIRDHTRKLLKKEDLASEIKANTMFDEWVNENKYKIIELQWFDESDRCWTKRQIRV